METQQRIGEVIEAGTGSFTAQSYDLWQLPAFGSLVKTGEGPLRLYGVVYHAATTGLEPGRKAVARGKDQPSEEDVFRSNPQLEQLLRSEFSALAVGFSEGGLLRRYLPPRPARIHSFVYGCSPEESIAFAEKLGFLSIILNAAEVPADELTAAVLRNMLEFQPDGAAFIGQAGRDLARLLSKDYGRLKSIVEKIEG
jgi:hypothetical protein